MQQKSVKKTAEVEAEAALTAQDYVAAESEAARKRQAQRAFTDQSTTQGRCLRPALTCFANPSGLSVTSGCQLIICHGWFMYA